MNRTVQQINGIALLLLGVLGATGKSLTRVSAPTAARVTQPATLALGSGSAGINKMVLADAINSYEPKVTDIFKSEPKIVTNPAGSTINPLTSENYLQPVDLYSVSPAIADNRNAVEALETYQDDGFDAALLAAGDDVEARHAVILKWLGVYG